MSYSQGAADLQASMNMVEPRSSKRQASLKQPTLARAPDTFDGSGNMAVGFRLRSTMQACLAQVELKHVGLVVRWIMRLPLLHTTQCPSMAPRKTER